MSFFDSNSAGGFSIVPLLKGAIIAFVITLIVFTIFSLLVAYAGFPESAINVISILTALLSVFLSGLNVSKKAKSAGWLTGCLTAAVYMLIFYVVTGLVFCDFSVKLYTLVMFLICILAGGVGGMIGINMKKKKSR